MLGVRAICQRPGVTIKARVSKAGPAGFMPIRPRSRVNTLPIVCKMHVPSDSFGGRSPERQAAMMMRRMFTFIAARIILAQLEGSGQGAIAAYNREHYEDLTTFLHDEPMGDPEEWLAKLMSQNSALACRLMEVRSTYVEEEFEWESLKRLAERETRDGNKSLMVQRAMACLMATPQEGEASGLKAAQAGEEGGSQ